MTRTSLIPGGGGGGGGAEPGSGTRVVGVGEISNMFDFLPTLSTTTNPNRLCKHWSRPSKKILVTDRSAPVEHPH